MPGIDLVEPWQPLKNFKLRKGIIKYAFGIAHILRKIALFWYNWHKINCTYLKWFVCMCLGNDHHSKRVSTCITPNNLLVPVYNSSLQEPILLPTLLLSLILSSFVLTRALHKWNLTELILWFLSLNLILLRLTYVVTYMKFFV